jgi:glycosyltransferase involved in cell wall biosynthesis
MTPSKSPTLLFLAGPAYPLGGMGEWLDYLMPGLSALGWHCTLGLTSGRWHPVPAYLRRHPWRNVQIISNPTGTPYGRVLAVAAAIQATQPDLLVVANIAAGYEAVRYLRRRGQHAPTVVMALHGLQCELLEDVRSAKDVLDGVVTVNRLAHALASEARGCAERVFYAPCGVDLPSETSPRAARWKGDRPLRLLFSGRVEQGQKRVLDLPALGAALLARGLSFRISVAGSGPADDMLRDKAKGLGVQAHFTFLGELEPAQVAQAYREHDALVVPSEWETGPLVAWEAMSHGLPVVASRYLGSGLEAALQDQVNCLLFPVGDITAAADAVLKLRDPSLVDSLVQGGYRLLQGRYSRQASVLAWADALSRALDLPPLPQPQQETVPVPAGRLDRWFGAAVGERVRRAFAISYAHAEPGSEWPHTLGSHCVDEKTFTAAAHRLDRVHEIKHGRDAATSEALLR